MNSTATPGTGHAGIFLLVLLFACCSLVSPVSAGEQTTAESAPSQQQLRSDAESLLERLAEQSRLIKPLMARIEGVGSTLELIDTKLLPGVKGDYERTKAAADAFEQEWRSKYAENCGRDFSDKEEYERWLRICKQQVAREDEIQQLLAEKTASYNKLVEERRKLQAQNDAMVLRMRSEKGQLDALLMQLVSNPLLLRCERCLKNIKDTISVADCYQTCWRSPG
jgi:hypothetical protein